MKITLKIHRSLRAPEDPDVLMSDEEGILSEIIIRMLKNYPSISEQLFEGEELKPGILYIFKQVELSSMGLLDETVDEDMEIKIVPILHGG